MFKKTAHHPQLAGLLTIVIATMFFASCGIASKTKDELFEEGLEHMNKNNFNGAIVLFHTALEKNQNFIEARLQLAQAYMSVGKYEKAEKEFQKVALQNPSNKEIHKEMARLYISMNNPDSALEEAQKYAEHNSDSAEIYEIMGYGYAQKREFDEAEKYFRKSLEAEPLRVSAQIGLARVYMAHGKNTDVRRLLGQIIKTDDGNVQAYYLLASLEESAGNKVEALKAYEKIAELDPDDLDVRFKIGLKLVNEGKLKEALEIGESMLERSPNRPEGYRLKGLAYYYGKQFDEAKIALQQSLTLHPNMGSYYFLGLSHYRKGESEQALSQFQKAIDMNPRFIQPRLMVSMILFQQGKIDDALAEAQRSVQLDDDNALAHNLLGSTYMAKGLYDEAMKEFDIALEIDPGLIDIHVKKGLFNLGKGKTDDAETDLIAAVEIAPEVLNTRLMLVSFYLKERNYDKALSILKDGIRGTAIDAVLYNHMAAAYFAQNKTDAALKSLERAKEANQDYYTPYFNLANYYIIRGNYEKALNEYNAVLTRDADNIRALLGSAITFELQGKDGEALSSYQKAISTKDSAGYIQLANYWLRKKDDDKALEVLKNAVRLYPDNTEVMEMKGQIYLKNGKFKEAVHAFEELDSYDHDKSLKLVLNTYYLSRDFKSALKEVQRELKKFPERIDLMGELSKIYLMMGDPYKAIENANTIIQKKPDSAAGYMVLAIVYDNQGKIDGAIDTLRKGIKAEDANLQAKMMLGGLLTRKQEYQHALETYGGIKAIAPRYVPALFAEGTVYDLMGKKEEAIKNYKAVLDKANNHIPALNNLAYLYIEGTGSKEEALDYAIRAYRLAPSNPSVMDTLGYALLMNGRTSEAVKILENASQLLPENPTVHYHLALAYKKKGDIIEAKKHLEASLSKNDFPEAQKAQKMLRELKQK